MNHKHRHRARDPLFARQVRELQHQVETTGRPGVIFGLVNACADCGADGAITILPGRRIIHHVLHDFGCPAAAGIVEWQPAS